MNSEVPEEACFCKIGTIIAIWPVISVTGVTPRKGKGRLKCSHRNMLALRQKVKNYFFEIFGIYSTIKAVFWHPRRKSQLPPPPTENSWRQPFSVILRQFVHFALAKIVSHPLHCIMPFFK